MSIVDAQGEVVAEYEYDPYGNILTATGPLADVNLLRYRGYVYDTETQFYYLQSRYYDPEIGRFINADALASTGQGILGNNMFAYCGNEPVRNCDPFGMVQQLCFPMYYEEGPCYIVDQFDESISDLPLGDTTVGSMGCAIVAIYNALVTVGENTSFDEIYTYFNTSERLVANGKKGIHINQVVAYLEEQGYTVHIASTFTPFKFNAFSKSADACIMLYMYGTKPMGHYIHYMRMDDEYIAFNDSESSTSFSNPYLYAHAGSRFFAFGIFIYDKNRS